MPTFLADPSSTLYILLGAMVIILGSIALRRQKRGDIITFGIAVVILLAVFLIDRGVESPREEVARKIAEMGTAAREKKPADLFQHVSESFKYKSIDKKGLQDLAQKAEGFGFAGIVEWDVKRKDFNIHDDGVTAEQSFRVQVKDHPETQRIVIATFRKDPDGQWRLTAFKTYNPVNAAEEMDIPGT